MNLLKKLLILSFLLTFAFPYQAFAYKVVLDAGHGGSDPGAIGINGLNEKDVNLDITQKLRDELARRGYDVVMTRTDDRYWSLAQRVEFTNSLKADLFVSVHANSHTSSKTNGSMVLYYDDAYPQEDYPASDTMKLMTPYSKDLAQHVLNSLLAASGTVNLGLVPSAVYVARMGTIPSILVETAFLSNTGDAALLADDTARTRMAIGIERGIEAYAPPVFTDTIGHWAREAILRMKNKNLIEGIGNRYEPERALTRAEFLTLMDRLFTFSKLKDPCSSSNSSTVSAAVYGCSFNNSSSATFTSNKQYKDLPATHWASPIFAKAKDLNLLQGYEDGTIRPDQSITRGEVSVLFDRLLQMAQSAAKQRPKALYPSFDDVPATLWSANAIYTLKHLGIINGTSENTFKPERTITRAEIAAMMDRYDSK
ncbi:N-acetylmuramoyl-L-alanine amidase [Paenibacillus sp. SYP-B3998]|uniref:N-acetylmuramoyl-L-alanine amidase n=1 Tax=Paenibacillus sp. SYP-B3998 TaxID=2678564 RepID=A0A6G3ZSC2_9BACL|nr:N-acetylmuramoyl-L-alanine amidase [Paenibacillus sp. SYP-B3998]NEW04489.1 N-acetylmuramoyl-L-alanine amidase [Paenibacillus sp. SYP-B3998]